MALMFADGFDWYLGGWSGGSFSGDLGKRWTGVLSGSNTLGAIATGYARSQPGQGCYISRASNDGGIYKTFGTSSSAGILGFAFYSASSLASRNQIIILLDGTTEQLSLRFNASSQVVISRNGTTLGTGTTVFSVSTWYYFELKFTINNSTGSVELRLNGATEIAAVTGIDTQNTANASFNGVALYITNSNGFTNLYDDMYVLDTTTGSNVDYLGPVKVVALAPAGNGTTIEWMPNGGSNMGAVSEQYEDGDATFNQSDTVGQIDTFEMQNVPIASGSVFAVQEHLVARQDAGSGRVVAPVLRIGGTNYAGTGQALTSSYQFVTRAYDVSPATSSAWSISEINGTEVGYKLES